MNLLTATGATVKQLPAEDGERELAARLKRGDPQALEQVVEFYGGRVLGLAARLLGWSEGADDVAQDVFLQVLRKGTTFRGEARLWTYLAAITVNRCRSVRRRRWLQDRVLATIGRGRGEETLPSATIGERDETAAAVRAAVARLTAGHREVIVLRYFEEMSIEEIAEVLAARRNTIEARLSRARKRLEPMLGELVD